MRLEGQIIVYSILLILALTGMMYFNGSRAEEQRIIQEQLREHQRIAREREVEIEELRARLESLPYNLPVDEVRISSSTGYRKDPMGGSGEYENLHKGVDLVGDVGDPVEACLAGTVVEHWIGKHPVFGRLIVIEHNDGEFFSLYGHLSESYVHEGDVIEAGERIGSIGNTGISTGPHLHFEIVVDPLEYLRTRTQ